MKSRQFEMIKLKTFGKITLLMLWGCLILITLKGIISILNPNKINQEDIKVESQKISDQRLIEDNAVAFAENFAREYMTYYKSEDEYKNRLKIFVDPKLDFTNTRDFSVSYVNGINHQWLNKNTIMVDCLVKGLSRNTLIDTNIITTEESLCIRSAVKVQNNDFIITDYPTLISIPDKAKLADELTLKGVELQDDVKKNEIKKVIESFLKAYYSGQNTEIDYFVENPQVKERKKSFEYADLKDFSVNWDEKNLFYVKAIYYVSKYNSRLIQGMQFNLKVKENKYIITRYNTEI